MKISKVEVIPIRPKQGLIGFAMIEMDRELVLHSIGIHRRRDGSGYRLTYPTQRGQDERGPLFHPITHELSKEIERLVFERVKNILGY